MTFYRHTINLMMLTPFTNSMDTSLRSLLDKHAPVKSRLVILRANSPLFNQSLLELKREKR